jgi:hypothetical protein
MSETDNETKPEKENRNNLGRTPRVQRVYDTGMQFSNALRLVGLHEESTEVEAWVLSVVKELTEKEKMV